MLKQEKKIFFLNVPFCPLEFPLHVLKWPCLGSFSKSETKQQTTWLSIPPKSWLTTATYVSNAPKEKHGILRRRMKISITGLNDIQRLGQNSQWKVPPLPPVVILFIWRWAVLSGLIKMLSLKPLYLVFCLTCCDRPPPSCPLSTSPSWLCL